MKTKIDERREREAYDKAHPWQPIATAMTNTGIVCQLQFADLDDSGKRRYFLGDDSKWYEVTPLGEPAGFSPKRPMNWRPVDPAVKLTPARRAEIIEAYHKRAW